MVLSGERQLDTLKHFFPDIIEQLKAEGNGNGGGDFEQRLGTVERVVLAQLSGAVLAPLAPLAPLPEADVEGAVDLIEVTANGKPSSEELGNFFMEDRGSLFS